MLDELGQRLLKPILEKLKNPNAQFSGYEFDTTGVTTHNENAWEQWVFEMCKTASTNILIYASDISSQFSIGTGEGVIGIALDDPQLNPYTYPGELARKFGRHWDGLIKMGKGIATFVGSIGAAGAEFGGGLGAASAITFTSAGTASPAGIVIVGVTTAAAAATVTAGTAASAAFLTAAALSMQRAANMKDPHVNPGGPGPNGNDPQQSGGGNGGSGNSGDPQDPKGPKKTGGGNGGNKNGLDGSKKPNGRYEDASYHHQNSKGQKNPAPKSGQQALDNSIQIKDNSPHRISVSDGEFVVLKKTSEGVYHGYSCSWSELHETAQRALISDGWVTRAGKILKSF